MFGHALFTNFEYHGIILLYHGSTPLFFFFAKKKYLANSVHNFLLLAKTKHVIEMLFFSPTKS